MSGRRVAAVVLVAIGVVGAAFLLVEAFDTSDSATPRPAGPIAGSLDAAEPAGSPFEGLTTTAIGVGGKCLRVVVADTESERVEGLRQRRDLGPYDGMLFVFDGPTDVGFTMSTVPVALDVGFYGAGGARDSSRHMKPCPRAESECPVYRADGTYTYALETLGGGLPAGSLSGCTPT